MKKTLLTLCVGFVLGFLIHALVFPDLFANGIILLPPAPTGTAQNGTTPAVQQNPVPQEQTITYDGSTFSRNNIRVEVSRYVSIVNESKTNKMFLASTYPALATPRPYGYKEEVRVRMDTIGQFVVYDKENPSLRLVITVR